MILINKRKVATLKKNYLAHRFICSKFHFADKNKITNYLGEKIKKASIISHFENLTIKINYYKISALWSIKIDIIDAPLHLRNFLFVNEQNICENALRENCIDSLFITGHYFEDVCFNFHVKYNPDESLFNICLLRVIDQINDSKKWRRCLKDKSSNE